MSPNFSVRRTWKAGLVWVALFSNLSYGASETASAAAAEAPVRMQPFKVFGEWMDIQPLLRGGVIDAIQILNVRKSSPAAAAGVRDGMRMVALQGVDVRGLSEAEFLRRMRALPASDRLRIKVEGMHESRELVIFITPRANQASAAAAPSPAAADQPAAPAEPASATAAGASHPVSPPPANRPAPDPTGATAKKLLAEIRRAIDAEATRMRAEARASGRAQSNPVVFDEATRLASEAAASNLQLVCEAAAEADESSAVMLASILAGGINQRRDYAPEQKQIVLQYLPRVPRLILTLEHMEWFAGADGAIAAGWKKARRDERDGMLTASSSSYAIVAAKCGVTDALVALARTVHNPDADKRARGKLLRQETEALRVLVPGGGDTPAALADFVLKNKGRLVFQPANAIYTLAR